MMRYLTLGELLDLYRRVMEQSGGTQGIRDMAGLESALAQPRMTFGGQDLYLTLVEKASALCLSLVQNHPFVDGNKRTGHAAMETFLVLNGFEIVSAVEEQEQLMVRIAAGDEGRDELVAWLKAHTAPLEKEEG